MAKILVVDDNRDIQELIKLLLKLNGHESKTASDFEEALFQINAFNPDLVMLDIFLNGEHGRDICAKIKSIYTIPVILLSANPAVLLNFDKCGADDVIEKPFEIKTVIDKINYLLNYSMNTVNN